MLAIAAGVLVAVSRPAIPLSSAGAIAIDSCAWVLFLTGAFVRFWSTLYIGGRKTHGVISEGPYSIVRNPLYFGTFLVGLSIALMLHSLVFLACVALGVVFYARATIPAEERQLLALHGEEYAAYLNRVPRLWPKLSLFRSPDEIVVRVRGLRMELKRASRWMWAPLIASAVNHARLESWWPDLLRLP